jgi:hypothetical protein
MPAVLLHVTELLPSNEPLNRLATQVTRNSILQKSVYQKP